MGINYYAVKKKPCLYNRVIHIGKASAGWLFLFRDNEEFHTFLQFKKWLNNGEYVLFDEYGREVDKDELLDSIKKGQNDEKIKNNPDNFNEYCKNIDGYRFTDRDFG